MTYWGSNLDIDRYFSVNIIYLPRSGGFLFSAIGEGPLLYQGSRWAKWVNTLLVSFSMLVRKHCCIWNPITIAFSAKNKSQQVWNWKYCHIQCVSFRAFPPKSMTVKCKTDSLIHALDLLFFFFHSFVKPTVWRLQNKFYIPNSFITNDYMRMLPFSLCSNCLLMLVVFSWGWQYCMVRECAWNTAQWF